VIVDPPSPGSVYVILIMLPEVTPGTEAGAVRGVEGTVATTMEVELLDTEYPPTLKALM